MRLRWKREEPIRGLASVGAGPRGSFLHDGEREYASTSYSQKRHNGFANGWFWVARNDDAGIPLMNTYKTLKATEDEAKAEALAYVKKYLNKE